MRGLHNDWWANLMLFALEWVVWVKNAVGDSLVDSCMERHVWALAILGQASTGMTLSCWVVICVIPLPSGRIHRSVRVSFSPCRISLPLYLTMCLSMLNVTVHPTSVNTQIPNKEAIVRLGMMQPVNVMGRPGMLMSHICVVKTCCPSANMTLSAQVVRLLFLTGIPSTTTKIWVTPELAMASLDGVSIAARALDG